MHNFHNYSTVVGVIKEILHSFNLPVHPVCTETTILRKNRVYIKDNSIVRCLDPNTEEFEFISDYQYGIKLLHNTKNFIIKSSNYDHYTHEYLGDYLRFVRDYNKVNLMGLYNCFNYKQPHKIDYSGSNVVINTDDNRFTYYIVPVKFDQMYTIALDSQVPYELACAIYNDSYISETPEELLDQSYTTINSSRFSSPFIYKTEFACADKLWSKEKDLKLIFKLPKYVNSTITVLEGDFTGASNVVGGNVINELIYDEQHLPDTYFGKLSLLSYNSHYSMPFAKRLIEYLLGHAITPLDNINENIFRVQQALYRDGLRGVKGIWDSKLHNDIYQQILRPDSTMGNNNPQHKRFIDTHEDILCYVDRDIETLLRSLEVHDEI